MATDITRRNSVNKKSFQRQLESTTLNQNGQTIRHQGHAGSPSRKGPGSTDRGAPGYVE